MAGVRIFPCLGLSHQHTNSIKRLGTGFDYSLKRSELRSYSHFARATCGRFGDLQ